MQFNCVGKYCNVSFLNSSSFNGGEGVGDLVICQK